jgi:hypothetical protein
MLEKIFLASLVFAALLYMAVSLYFSTVDPLHPVLQYLP